MGKRKKVSGMKPSKKAKALKISEEVLYGGAADNHYTPTSEDIKAIFSPSKTSGFLGIDNVRQAQDAALDSAGVYTLLQHSLANGLLSTIPQFIGYGVLANLTQDWIMRAGIEMRADEMTRKWIELTHLSRKDNKLSDIHGDNTFINFLNAISPIKDRRDDLDAEAEAKAEEERQFDEDRKIAQLNSEFDRFEIRKLFRDAAALCGYFGGCLAYIDMGNLDANDLKTPLRLDADTFEQGSLRGFKLIEPYNIAPGFYNTSSPMSEDYFKPQSWYVMGQEIHASRFLYFAEGLPPTLLLPSYNFFGIPLAQSVLDVVTHFTQCREAAARMVTKYSLTVYKTDLSSILEGGTDNQVRNRIQLFAQNRDNDGIMVIDNEREDILNITANLGGLTDMVRQSEEMVAAAFGEPAVKLWGISPAGFSATGESDMRNHYDHINSTQEKVFRAPLTQLLKLLQLNTNGRIDEGISFNFVPLGSDDDAAIAQVQQTKASTMNTLLQMGVVDAMECRKALSEDPKSQFTDIDPNAEPEQPEGMPLPDMPTQTSENGANSKETGESDKSNGDKGQPTEKAAEIMKLLGDKGNGESEGKNA